MGSWFSKDSAAGNAGRTVECSICYDTLPAEHEGIQCIQGHHLCLEICSRQFVETVLEEPAVRIPVKCPTCGILLADVVLQHAMTPDQYDKFQFYYLHLTANKMTENGEVFCMCPFCQYFEYRVADEEDVVFLRCKKSSCAKISCFICKLRVDTSNSENMSFHMKCASLRALKREVEEILSLGNAVPCPQCGLSGMKDLQCSHICCPNCKTHWCYACGKVLAPAGTRVGHNVYGHFLDWQNNIDRCPTYLQSISNVNKTFPNDACGALQKFHQNRSLVLLKGFVDKIGIGTFTDLCNQFDAVRNCGFTLQEIQRAPGHVFRPKNRAMCLIQ